MTVALVTSLLGGGPIEHTLVLARGLVAAGERVRVVCATRALARRFAATGAEPLVLPLRRTWDVQHGVAVGRAVGCADVVHAQDRRAGLWTRIVPRAKGTALVYTVHGMPDPYLPPPAGPKRPGLRAALAYRGVDVALVHRADAVVTPSAAVAAALVAQLGYPASALTVVPNGVPVPALCGDGTGVGTLSVLEPVKGLDVFLGAVARIAPDHPEVAFVVFGSGSQDTELRQCAATLGLADRVTFAGHTPTDHALARLAVLALPSLMENCPMAMLEAMAAGVPVVASRVGGIPEMAPPGTAVLIPPSDPAALATALATLLNDPGARAAQATAARRHVEREASQAVMTERMRAVYECARTARRSS